LGNDAPPSAVESDEEPIVTDSSFEDTGHDAGTDSDENDDGVQDLIGKDGSGVQRSGDARGDCLFGCPLPNSSIEQCRIMVIVNGYTLFVASLCYVIITFTDQRFGEVCSHNMHIQGRRSSGRETVPSPRRSFYGLSPSLQTKLQTLPN